eukprot:sb/3476328/
MFWLLHWKSAGVDHPELCPVDLEVSRSSRIISKATRSELSAVLSPHHVHLTPLPLQTQSKQATSYMLIQLAIGQKKELFDVRAFNAQAPSNCNQTIPLTYGLVFFRLDFFFKFFWRRL